MNKEDCLRLLEDLRILHNDLILQIKTNPEKFKKHFINMQMTDKVEEMICESISTLESNDKRTIKQYISLRNLKKLYFGAKLGLVFCPATKDNAEFQMNCFSCPYGHLMECHYPFDCDSPYCNHRFKYGLEEIPEDRFWNIQEGKFLNPIEFSQLWSILNDKARELLGDLNNFSPTNQNISKCAVCKEDITDTQLIEIFANNQEYRICFHIRCCLRKDIDLERILNE